MEDTLTLSRLKILRAIAEERSVTGAARKLHVTQPAVSAQLRELERGLDVALVERAGRGVVLTEAGRTLAEHATRILEVEGEALRAVARLRGMEAGRLAVGASETPGHYLLLDAVADFHRRYPSVAIEIAIAPSARISRQVIDGVLELGLVEGLVDDEALIRRRYRDDELELIVAPGDPLAAKARVTADDLAPRDFVMREKGSAVRATVDAALARAGIAPSVGLEFSSTEAVKRAVAAGLGISFVPQASLAIERAAKSLVTPPLSGIEIRRRLWLIRAARHRPSPAAEAFMAMIRTA